MGARRKLVRLQNPWSSPRSVADRQCRESAPSVLDEYIAKIGGRENLYNDGGLKKKRSRASMGTPTPAKRVRKNGTHTHPADIDTPASAKAVWQPPAGSWEDHIDQLDVNKNEHGDLRVFVTWKNGQKSRHETQVVYKRCPQKVCYLDTHYRSSTDFREDASILRETC